MTLIACASLPDMFLLAVDDMAMGTAGSDERFFTSAVKSFEIRGVDSVRWAYAGSVSAGDGVVRHLRETDMSGSDWPQLLEVTRGVLAKFNAEGRSRSEATKSDQFQPCEIVLAGTVQGIPQVAYFDDAGGVGFVDVDQQGGAIFLGIGVVAATVAWNCAVDCGVRRSRELLENVMRWTIRVDPELSGDIVVHELPKS